MQHHGRPFLTMISKTTTAQALLLLLQFGVLPKAVNAEIHYTDLFPPNDDYDPKILDPHTVYGSPYGGFSRAIPSRLAALSLDLPALTEESEDKQRKHYKIRDGNGRLLVCRTYLEEELEPESFAQSMFTSPVLFKNATESEKPAAKKDLGIPELSAINEKAATTTQDEVEKMKAEIHHVTSILKHNFKNICTQLHKGWWSYEWCFSTRISQFHIEMSATNELTLSQVTKLGFYQERMFIRKDNLEKRRKEDQERKAKGQETKASKARLARDEIMLQYIDDETELGIVTDSYKSGDKCDDGQPRETDVEYRCCSLKNMNKFHSGVLHNGKPSRSNIASIISIQEPEICKYHILLCTPLMCNGLAELYEDGLYAAPLPRKNTKFADDTSIEDEAVRDVLARILTKVCLISGGNEWWAYEFCYGKHVRQFHEEAVMDPVTGVTKKAATAEFMLGKYSSALDEFDDDLELDYVVNATDEGSLIGMDSSGGGVSSSKDKKAGNNNKKNTNRGNGAYFSQEYTDGTVCENDETLKEKTGGIIRSTTVRYFCGPRKELASVNEDSTCHYELDVTLPELCQHPLFRAPVMKKRVVKCLPAPDEKY